MNRVLALILTLSFHVVNAQNLSLEEYLSKVSSANLDLKVNQAKFDSADARSIGLAIPPPMIGFTQLKETDGPTTNGFEISQNIPFPTKLTGDHSSRKYEALAQKENLLSSKNQTLAQAKLLYFSLWYSQEKIALLEEKKSVFQNHIKLSRSTARSDSFSAIHLLKAESELDLLENEIESSQQMMREKQLEAAVFISEDPKTFKITASEPKISEIPQITNTDDSHQLKALKFNVESLKAKEFEAKSSWLPDFNLRYKEMGRTSSMNKSNEVMIGITLPFIFFWEPYSASSQAIKERLMADYEFEKQKRTIDSNKILLLSRAESLKKQIDTLNTKLIPRAEKRMRLVHNLAPRDMETLQDHRETMEAFPELKIKNLDLRMEYEQTISILEKYALEKDTSNE